jgi:hypothetical protein
VGDEDGLSIASSHEIAKTAFERGYGVAALEIERIEQIEPLRVFREDDAHGFIQNLPDNTPENYDLVMGFADKLVALSVVLEDRWDNRKRPEPTSA